MLDNYDNKTLQRVYSNSTEYKFLIDQTTHNIPSSLTKQYVMRRHLSQLSYVILN